MSHSNISADIAETKQRAQEIEAARLAILLDSQHMARLIADAIVPEDEKSSFGAAVLRDIATTAFLKGADCVITGMSLMALERPDLMVRAVESMRAGILSAMKDQLQGMELESQRANSKQGG